MIRLLFVGDGERDAAMNPPLIEKLVGTAVDPSPIPRPRLNEGGKGYDRKLLFAIRTARDLGLQGVVATVDQDKSPGKDRLRELIEARRRDREREAPLPTAVGCAVPHAEAWLLDDPVAVRTVLELGAQATIPSVRRTASPKDELTSLHRASPRNTETTRTILVEIARHLDHARCQHADETGFTRFADDVKDEISRLV